MSSMLAGHVGEGTLGGGLSVMSPGVHVGGTLGGEFSAKSVGVGNDGALGSKKARDTSTGS